MVPQLQSINWDFSNIKYGVQFWDVLIIATEMFWSLHQADMKVAVISINQLSTVNYNVLLWDVLIIASSWSESISASVWRLGAPSDEAQREPGCPTVISLFSTVEHFDFLASDISSKNEGSGLDNSDPDTRYTTVVSDLFALSCLYTYIYFLRKRHH